MNDFNSHIAVTVKVSFFYHNYYSFRLVIIGCIYLYYMYWYICVATAWHISHRRSGTK